MTTVNTPILLLDVMSTLVYDPFHQEMPAFFGLTLDELLAQKDPRAWVDFEYDAIDEATFFERFFADRRGFDGDEFRRITAQAYRLLDGIEPLLDELKHARVPMHALSNYPRWYRLIEERTGLSRWVPWSFVSCDLGLRKPDPEIYREVVRRLEVPAQRCIFVDDTPRNVEAARAEGMTGIVFEDADALRRDLVGLGALPERTPRGT